MACNNNSTTLQDVTEETGRISLGNLRESTSSFWTDADDAAKYPGYHV